MKRNYGCNLIAACVAGALAGISGQAVADDTEIYLGSGGEVLGTVRPNVLFALDTSGSMSNDVPGTGLDRLDNMKVALKAILDQSSNINVGLMRFTDPGGPILFPVADIDADVTEIEGTTDPEAGADILSRILPASGDDAYQFLPDNPLDPSDVILNDDELPFGASVTGTVTTFTRRTQNNLDTQEEVEGGAVQAGGNNINMNAAQINGIRFPNVTIPQGSFIVDAFVTGTSPFDYSGSNIGIRWRGERNGNSAIFTTSDGTVENRPRTTDTVLWQNVPNFTQNQSYATPDLTSIVQAIVCQGVATATAGCPNAPYANGADGQAWNSGNALAFLQDLDPANDADERAFYTHFGAGVDSRRPLLTVRYQPPSQATDTVIGLRFENIGVPQGATVTGAFLDFTASQSSSDPTAQFEIRGHLFDDAPAIQNSGDKIAGRPATTAVVQWGAAQGLTEWEVNSVYTTPDLTDIIQEIVNQPGWCGNNAVSIEIETIAAAAASRVAYSSEGSSAGSPVLRIDWDESTGEGGCINQIVTVPIVATDDDIDERVSDGNISLNNNYVRHQATLRTGMRFREVDIPQGATVLEATLLFTATDGGNAAQSATALTITFRGEAADDAAEFTNATNNLSNRADTTASVAWAVPAFTANGVEVVSPNLATIIQEIVSRPGWAAGNDLVIQTSSSGANARRYMVSFNSSPAQAPILRVKTQYSGEIVPPVIKTVRERLKELVSDLTHEGFTPLVGQLYEAAQYYRGGDVVHGLNRGHFTSERPRKRVSHPASWTGGTLSRPPGCTDETISQTVCNGEQITGSATYVSPIGLDCQASYIVQLTDGIANHNANESLVDHRVDLVEDLVGTAGITCDSVTSGERCGRELATFLHTEDQRPDLDGLQTITTYTIGFNLCDGDLVGGVCCASGQAEDSDGDGNPDTCPAGQEIDPGPAVQYLQDLAFNGGGQFYEAQSASQLVSQFEAIVSEILSQPTSFATPSLTINAFNKLFVRNEVYFSLFEPSTRVKWNGNVKKYKICDLDTITDCTLGEILDANDEPAIGDDNRIKETSQSVWSDTPDGLEITVGGAGAQIPASASRDVYTYTGTGGDPNADPNNVLLAVTDHEVRSSNAALTKTLLGDPAMTDTERSSLALWIRGRDMDDEDGDNIDTENRFALGDPLHASPTAVTYGGTEADPVIKLFVATNDGGMRMINSKSGIEQWIFFPQETLVRQRELRANATGSHIYLLDATPEVWRRDVDNNGIIEQATDFVRIIFGMRSGGHNLYALDVTPAQTLSNPDAVNDIQPTYMWRILGGDADVGGPFERLGQTWSRPQLTTIRFADPGGGSMSKEVLIFGGGHDSSLDGLYGTSNVGNAIFIVDPVDGTLVWSASNTGSGATLEVPGMDFPFPSDLALLDSNGDGDSDRIYAPDLGGNIWRIDLGETLDVGDSAETVVGKFASISSCEDACADPATEGTFTADTRHFYHAADIVQVNDTLFSNEGRYDYVIITSGTRQKPRDQVIHNKVYAFRDYAVDGMADTDDNHLADPATFATLDESDLADVTGNELQLNNDGTPAEPEEFADKQAELKLKSGWFIDLKEPDGSFIGEKGLARPVVLAGKLFFTTYVPEISPELASECQIAEGDGRLYGLNVLTGAALFANWDADGGPDPTKEDRFFALGGGLPSEAVPVFQKEGVTIIVGGGGGATTVDPGIDLPRERTYWYQE